LNPAIGELAERIRSRTASVDARHSLADLSLVRSRLEYERTVNLEIGLRESLADQRLPQETR
jgi:hypothetical protein